MRITQNSVCRKSRRWLLLATCWLVWCVLPAAEESKSEAPAPAAKEGEAPAKAAGKVAKAEGKAAEGEGGEGGEEKKTEAPHFQLAPPLNGFFDLSTLRAAAKASQYRYPLKDLQLSIGSTQTRILKFSCVIEFGAETGLAEIEQKEFSARDIIGQVVIRFTLEQLLTVSGKRQLKDELIAAINQKLTTAQARDLYFTDFLISK